MNFLAISGSLRQASLNSALLRATARLAPPGVTVRLFQGLADVPIFNPDVEDTEPAPVARLREQVLAADALIIASPEYAHGITGVLKNALDWLVGCEAFINKPVALFNASPRSVHAIASLREVVGVMSARVVDAACIVVPLGGSGFDERAINAAPAMSATVRQALAALSSAVAEFRRGDEL